MLESLLVKEKLLGLKIIVKELWIHLNGDTRKQDIIECLMCMARIGCYRKMKANADSDNASAISYLTNEMKWDLCEIPSFSSLTNWMENLAGVLAEFTSMNLFTEWTKYLNAVHKSFNLDLLMHIIFVHFVRNVWVYECPRINLRVLYFRAYVHHSHIWLTFRGLMFLCVRVSMWVYAMVYENKMVHFVK